MIYDLRGCPHCGSKAILKLEGKHFTQRYGRKVQYGRIICSANITFNNLKKIHRCLAKTVAAPVKEVVEHWNMKTVDITFIIIVNKKEGIKMRNQETITKEKELMQAQIESMIKASIESTTCYKESMATNNKCYKEAIAEGQKKIKALDAEPCYEDTLDGQIETAEADAILMINGLLDELTITTGIKYPKLATLFASSERDCILSIDLVKQNVQ